MSRLIECEVCHWVRVDSSKLCTVYLWEPVLHLMLAGTLAQSVKRNMGG
jgi:hypothetical protein